MSHSSTLPWFLVLFSAAVAGAAEEARKVKLPSGRDVLARGEQLYQGHCALCHGPKGDGGRGANLAQPKLRRATDDAALVGVITTGIPRTEMPGAWQLTENEIRIVSAFVKTLGRVPVKPLPGNSARGEQLYHAKGGCAACHTLKQKTGGYAGGITGPDLSDIGARRSGAHLRASLVDPEADVPVGFLQVRLVQRDGVTVTGVRLNENTFSIQVRDATGNMHSFWKGDLAEIHKDYKKSPMPSYKSNFNDTEMDDIVAFLASLREGL